MAKISREQAAQWVNNFRTPESIARQFGDEFGQFTAGMDAVGRQKVLDDALPKLEQMYGKAAADIARETVKVERPNRTVGETLSDWGNIALAGIDQMQQPFMDLYDPSSERAVNNRKSAAAHLAKLSEQQRFDDYQADKRMAEADGEFGKVSAWLGNFARNPVRQGVQLGASVAPGAAIIAGGLAAAPFTGGASLAAAVPLAMGVGAAQGIGGARGTLYEETLAQADADLMRNNEQYRLLRQQGMSEAAAKNIVGTNIAEHLPELALSGASGAILERFGLGAVGKAAKGSLGRIGAEMLSEGTDEAAQTVLSNSMVQSVNPDKGYFEDALLSGVQGAVAGVGTGGLAAYLGRHNNEARDTGSGQNARADAADRLLSESLSAAESKLPVSGAEVLPEAEVVRRNTAPVDSPAGRPADTARERAAAATTDTGRIVRGNAHDVIVGGRTEPVVWELREASDMAAAVSKADNQYRDRNRQAGQVQIDEIARNLNYRRLNDAPEMDSGAPTLANDGKTVIGGNGRIAAVKQAYGQGTAENYRRDLTADAARFGIAPEAVAQFDTPVLVRRLVNDVDIKQAAIASNEGGSMAMSALEQAKADFERLPPVELFAFNDDGTLNQAASRKAVAHFVGNLPQNQRNAVQTADGYISQQGLQRIENALLYGAYGDSPTLARAVETADGGRRNINRALVQSANTIAQARNDAAPSDGMAYGSIYDRDIATDLMAAADLLEQIRRNGGSVSDFLAQQDLERERQSPVVEMLLQFMEENSRSAKKIRELIQNYYEAVRALGNPNEADMFGGAEIPAREQLLKGVIDGQADTGREAQRSDTAATGGFEQYGTQSGGTAAADLQPAEQSRDGAGDGGGVAEDEPAGVTEAGAESDGLFSQSAMKSVEANIRRGREAMNRALTEKADVKRAMFRQDLGWVDFVWGDDGTTRPLNKKGEPVGKGLSHILEARQRKDGMSYGETVRMLTDNIVEAIARGTVVNRWERHDGKSVSVQIDYDGYRAGLVKNKGSNAWMVTAFELYETGAEPAGSVDTDNATHTKPTLTRQDVGAVSNTEKNIPQNRAQDKGAYQAKLDEALGRLAGRVTLVTDVKREIPASAERILSNRYDGAFDAAAGRVYLFAENLAPERAAFVAWHELGHRGFARGEFRDYRAELRRLDKHSIIAQLADSIQAQRPDGDPAKNRRDIALEEAAVELYAAKRTGEWEALEARYGVMMPQMLRRRTDSILQNVWEKLRAFVSRVFGRDTGDAQLVSLLDDLHRDVSADTAAETRDTDGLSDDALMSIYSDDADKVERALKKMAAAYPGELTVYRDSSRASDSEYIELSDNDKGLYLKIRVSDHALPAHHRPFYDMFDVFPRKGREKNARGKDAKYYTDGSWVEAVAFAGEMFGLKVPKYVQNILDKDSGMEKAAPKSKAPSKPVVRDTKAMKEIKESIRRYREMLSWQTGDSEAEVSNRNYLSRLIAEKEAEYQVLYDERAAKSGIAKDKAQDGMRFSQAPADAGFARKAAFLQGEPVYRITERTAPRENKALRQWAVNLFNQAGGKAVNPEIGEVRLTAKSVKDSLAHGINPNKAMAFEAVPTVIEKGVVVAETEHDRLTSYFISAPVEIDGKDDIVTVLVRKDMNTQRMYLHSVITKDNLLNTALTGLDGDSAADTGVSEPRGKLNSGDVASILRRYLNYKPGAVDADNPDMRFSLSEGADSALLRPKAESFEKLRAAEPVRISGREIEADADLRRYKRNALEYGKRLRGTYVNRDTGREINLSLSGLKEVLQHDYKNIGQLQSVAAIPQIIEKGIYIDRALNEDTAVNPDVESYEYYVAGLDIGGTDYTVRATVAVGDNGERYYDHKLTNIEKGNLLSTAGITNPSFESKSPLKIDDKRLLQILQEEAGDSPDILFSQSMQTPEEVRAFAETGEWQLPDSVLADMFRSFQMEKAAAGRLKDRVVSMKDKVIEAVEDAQIQLKRWADDLPYFAADEQERQMLEQSYRRGASMRDAENERFDRLYLQPFNRSLAAMKKKNPKHSLMELKKLVGYWMSAQSVGRIPESGTTARIPTVRPSETRFTCFQTALTAAFELCSGHTAVNPPVRPAIRQSAAATPPRSNPNHPAIWPDRHVR
ncbi:hypothetical protein [Neisseria leonii]|uniref:LPD3 domain-containing protein n=1 Tax=Neisseria leonii TaxID=2995413 RepID=UPI0030CB5C4A